MAEKSGDDIRATIRGNVSGQVAVGKDITQQQVHGTPQVTEADLAALHAAIADIRAQVEGAAPPEKRQAALERVDELEEAATAEKPDLSTMEYVTRWFARNLPTLAGAVSSVVISPIVGRLVQAGGDVLVEEFRRRFGREPASG